jgi:hypothetical protein
MESLITFPVSLMSWSVKVSFAVAGHSVEKHLEVCEI